MYNDPDLLRQKSDELSDLRFHQEELFAAWEAAMEEQDVYKRQIIARLREHQRQLTGAAAKVGKDAVVDAVLLELCRCV